MSWVWRFRLTGCKLSVSLPRMTTFSTREAARKLGITQASLSRYVAAKKVPTPKAITSGRMTLHLWTAQEIEHVRKLLPKIANGRKTRWQRQREKEKEKKGPPPRAAVPHKQGSRRQKPHKKKRSKGK